MWRGWRRRCPRCGVGRLFSGWFSMRPACSECGLDFRREPGFYLGSIYINYGLTALLVTAAYFGLYFSTEIDSQVLLWSLLAFCLLFPVWFFPYSRSLWLAFDQYWDPDPQTSPQQSPQ